jgi:hypothetical protein
MFKDRELRLPVLFSTLWHLFWISVIGIVITPSVQPSNVYQEVEFLGPILEKTAFDLMLDAALPQTETLYTHSTLFLDNVYLRPKGPQRKVLREFKPGPGAVFDMFAFSFDDYGEDAKDIPAYFDESMGVLYAHMGRIPKSVSEGMRRLQRERSIEGPAGEREVIFKPEALTVQRGLYGDAEGFVVKVKFFIGDNGMIHDAEPVMSSGLPEIDLKAIRYLKEWRFSPAGFIEKGRPVWGIVTVEIKAR